MEGSNSTTKGSSLLTTVIATTPPAIAALSPSKVPLPPSPHNDLREDEAGIHDQVYEQEEDEEEGRVAKTPLLEHRYIADHHHHHHDDMLDEQNTQRFSNISSGADVVDDDDASNNNNNNNNNNKNVAKTSTSTVEEEGEGEGEGEGEYVTTNIPLRLDRLPWSGWHWMITAALGISWILDGLEMTIVGAVSGVLQKPETLHLSNVQIGILGSLHIIGAVVGSLLFGFLADRFGRKKLFVVTPLVYLTSTFLTAFTWEVVGFGLCQFFKGLGIGGEYSAMNSAINEFIPARVRGAVDIVVNGSYWVGAALGSLFAMVLVNPNLFPLNIGWRLPFFFGALIGIIIIITRLFIPESPRWLISRNRIEEAEAIIHGIERKVEKSFKNGEHLEEVSATITVPTQQRKRRPGLMSMLQLMFVTHWRSCVLGLSLMISQAFFYNAVGFTYSLILIHYYAVSAERVGLYIVPFALGNFLGVVFLGRFFDTLGRKRMIFLTYTVSALLLVGTGVLFVLELLSALTQTLCWSLVFFVASAGASSAYLTVSEVFPVEIRALSISVFYSVGTGVGGALGPVLFGKLIQEDNRENLFGGYVLGSSLMILAAFVELWLGVKAEQRSLEEVVVMSARRGGGDATTTVNVVTTTNNNNNNGSSSSSSRRRRRSSSSSDHEQHPLEQNAESATLHARSEGASSVSEPEIEMAEYHHHHHDGNALHKSAHNNVSG